MISADRLRAATESTAFRRASRLAAVTLAVFLGSACTPQDKNNKVVQQPESVISVPTSQPIPPEQFIPSVSEDTGKSEATTVTEQTDATRTYLPQIALAEAAEQESQGVIIFSGDPASPEGQKIGDGGFRSDCDFGRQECGRDQKILWGPFLRDFDQPELAEMDFDDSTLEVTVNGTGWVKIGATDSKMGDGDSFLFFEENVELPYTFKIYWPGLKPQTENGPYNGYGLEITAEPIIDPDPTQQPQAIVTDVIIKKIADGNVLQAAQ